MPAFVAVIAITDPTYLSYAQLSPTYIYTRSLHDALPISQAKLKQQGVTNPTPEQLKTALSDVLQQRADHKGWGEIAKSMGDRKSTRLNSSHEWISYAVFCLKKKTYTGR